MEAVYFNCLRHSISISNHNLTAVYACRSWEGAFQACLLLIYRANFYHWLLHNFLTTKWETKLEVRGSHVVNAEHGTGQWIINIWYVTGLWVSYSDQMAMTHHLYAMTIPMTMHAPYESWVTWSWVKSSMDQKDAGVSLSDPFPGLGHLLLLLLNVCDDNHSFRKSKSHFNI